MGSLTNSDHYAHFAGQTTYYFQRSARGLGAPVFRM
jgi:hypothetical protein